MFAAYAIVGGAWLVLALCNWRDLLHLQVCRSNRRRPWHKFLPLRVNACRQILISGIVFVSMVEACSWNILFVTYNESGEICE